VRQVIPAPVIAVLAEVAAGSETHASLDSLFMYAGAPGDPPEGSKHVKVLAWLRRVNQTESVAPLVVLGRIIEAYMDVEPDRYAFNFDFETRRKERLSKVLGECQLQYLRGGTIAGALAAPSRTLSELIRANDYSSINEEFERALRTVEASPRDAVSAACNILEAVCKTYIEDEHLEMPAKQDLQPVWTVVRKHLGFDPAAVPDRDLQEILSGLLAIVSGIGALRTHASSAHASGRKAYRLEPRHARLAVHAAHTCALFILESWHRRKGTP
jgi:Abortive infection C-terminus